MRLPEHAARDRLVAHDHGVLSTVHPQRGVDSVPAVYAVDGPYLGVPVDLVKPKASVRLQRVRNLERDPRAMLLAEHWDRLDWSRRWWARAELHWLGRDEAELSARLGARLVERYVQYRDTPFAEVLVFRIVAVTGWAADADDGGPVRDSRV